MADATLFHLHFNTPEVDAAAARLADAGVPCTRRFGSVRGEGVSLDPGEPEPADFRFKLQVHERDAVNLTLAPGRRARFDHFGVLVDDVDAVLDRARTRGWSVRPDDRRTFATTPWGFRVELHARDGDLAPATPPAGGYRLDGATLELGESDAASEAFDDVLGSIPALSIVDGERPWVSSFALGHDGPTTTVDVAALLDENAT